MLLKATGFLFILILAPGPPELWMQPQQFRCQPGEELRIDVMVGDNLTGDRWNRKTYKAQKLFMVFAAGQTDLLPVLEKSGDKPVSYKPLNEGTYVAMLESNAIRESIAAVDVQTFVEENGLERAGIPLGSDLVLNTVSFAKLMVQAGANPDKAIEKRGGLRLEIVPAKNPYSLKSGDHLTCLFLFDGKPLPHTLVKIWYRYNRTTFLQNAYTGNDGTVTFPLGVKGIWMVSVVKILPSGKASGEWENLRSSLTFGI